MHRKHLEELTLRRRMGTVKKNKMGRKVVVVDPAARSIVNSVVSSLEDAQAIVGGLIERICTLPNGDEVYANEEALFNSELVPFLLVFEDVPPIKIVGPAYIIGSVTDSGNNRDVSSTVDKIRKCVVF